MADDPAPPLPPFIAAYRPRREATRRFLPVRGLRYHLHTWGDPGLVTPDTPALVMVHGWMDVGASYQFVVDALPRDRYIVAPDWRGFGLTTTAGADNFWFADYLADLDTLLDALLPGQAVDLVGHSMGGNVAMIYAGVRPQRLRRLVNLEGFGMPDNRPAEAPGRYARWLDQLKAPASLRSYASVDEVAARLMANNPLLPADKAAWLATHWSARRDDGRWHLLAEPAHKHLHANLYRKDEVLAIWQRIAAPLLWVEGDRTDIGKWWGDRYTRAEFESRLAVVPQVERLHLSPAGHMLHHDQPQALAARLEDFLNAP